MTTYKKLALNTSESNCVGNFTKITTNAECQKAGQKLSQSRHIAGNWGHVTRGCSSINGISHWNSAGSANRKNGGVSAICKTSGGGSNKCNGTVTLHQHGGFGGWRANFGRGDYNFNEFVRRARNDDASSITIPQGCKAELYQHGGFGGWKAEFGPGSYDYPHFIKTGAVNDDASTIKVKNADDGSYITKGKGICDWHYMDAPRGPHGNQGRVHKHDMASCAEACKKVPNCKRFSLSVHGCRLSKCGSNHSKYPGGCSVGECPISTAHGGTWGELKGDGEFKMVHIGNSNGAAGGWKSGTAISNDYKCPEIVSKDNWDGCHPHCGRQYGDSFQIKQEGGVAKAARRSGASGALRGAGWGMNLRFKCYKTPKPLPAAPGRPSSTTLELGGYEKHVNKSAAMSNLKVKNVPVTFKGTALDGATMCNHYNSCSGFSYDVNNKIGNLKTGVQQALNPFQGHNYYTKITAVSKAPGKGWSSLTDMVIDEARISQKEISDGYWDCRTLAAMGHSEHAVHRQTKWWNKCQATVKSWRGRANGVCKGAAVGGKLSDAVCKTRSWVKCHDNRAAHADGSVITRDENITRPDCRWVDQGPPSLTAPSINRRAGVRKTYYDEIKRQHTPLQAAYNKIKNIDVPTAIASRTAELDTQAADFKRQREQLQQILTEKYAKLTTEHQEIIKKLIKKSSDLEKEYQELETKHSQLLAAFEEKKARILELQHEIKVETENAAAKTAAFKEELEKWQNDTLLEEKKILEAKKKIQTEKIKIDNAINDLNLKIIEYSNLLVKSKAEGERILGLEDIKLNAENKNASIARENAMAPSLLSIHNGALKQLEADLAKYKENPKREPIVLINLLNRKKKLMGKVFDASEEKYNMNTGRMERRHLIDAPAKLLLNSQLNESKQLKRKIDLLTKDLSTSAKSTQMNNNEVKKRDYFMFILKYISISSLFLILTGLVIKNGNVSPGIGYGIMAIVVIVLILVIGLNMFYNKNRNQVYFNKRDWDSVNIKTIDTGSNTGSNTGSKKCSKK